MEYDGEQSISFLLRLNDHIQYLRRIQATLDGTGDFFGNDFHDCKLGKWLYGSGPEEAEGPEAKALFDSLFEPHERFHNASHTAIKKKEEGDGVGVKVEITLMMKLSVVLADTLLALDNTASGGPNLPGARAV